MKRAIFDLLAAELVRRLRLGVENSRKNLFAYIEIASHIYYNTVAKGFFANDFGEIANSLRILIQFEKKENSMAKENVKIGGGVNF